MKNIRFLISTMLVLFVGSILPLYAEEAEELVEENATSASTVKGMDEITVSARKREESLVDIPVSISVLSSDDLAQQNIISQNGLADLIPGLTYNEGNQGTGGESDRIAALPSIRGISSSEIATNRTKVTSFVDGIPVIGSVGAINIGGATQVEVFNGPQSAAFGRSTFGGAINYVTRDPGDEISGSLGINWSDQGTRIISGNVGGPINDVLGFQIGASHEDSEAPEDFYTFSDGTEAGTRGGDNYSGRLVFTPNDNLTIKFTASHDETDDGITARNFYATQESSAACFNGLNSFDLFDGMGMLGSSYAGVFDCELQRDPNAILLGVQDIGAYYRDNPALLDSFVAGISDVVAPMSAPGTLSDLAIANALASDAGFSTIQEAMLALADAFSVPDEFAGSQSERDRLQAQVEYLFDNDSFIQLSVMTGEETYIRDRITFDSLTPYELGFDSGAADPMAMGAAALPSPPSINWVLPAGMAGFSMSDPTTIDEDYIELRWASPAQSRMRYVVGASLYEYEFLTEIYDEGYNAVRLGLEQAVFDLTGDVIAPNRTISETAENLALFGNLSYDFTDKITGSIEARYSQDDVGAVLLSYTADANGNLTSESFDDSVKTTTITPRLALTYAISDTTNAYAQYAIGINPGGVNSDFLNPNVISSFNEGYFLDLNADGFVDTSDPNELYVPADNVNYNLDRYAQLDEEKLSNFELGLKGDVLDGRLSYSAALYYMVWDDQTARIAVDWENPNVTNDEDLYYTPIGTTGELYIPASDLDSVETGVGGFFTNQGQSTSNGIELQGRFQINDSWNISANASFAKAEYSDYCSEDDFNGIARGANADGSIIYSDIGDYAGLPVSVSEQGNPCYVLDGKALTRQPDFSLSLSPTYRTELANGIGLSVNSRMQYTDGSFNDVANISETPSTLRINLTFGLTWEDFSGTFYIQNLTDETASTFGNLVQSNTYEGTYGPGTVDPSQVFLTSPGSGLSYSNFEYSIPTGRNYGFRANYRF